MHMSPKCQNIAIPCILRVTPPRPGEIPVNKKHVWKVAGSMLREPNFGHVVFERADQFRPNLWRGWSEIVQ